MKPAVQRVMQALRGAGIETEPVEFAESTRTAEDAARAIGVEVGQIVKSLLFLREDEPVLVLVSGSNRVAVAKLAAALCGSVRRADAETVRAAAGYAIGGVPPLGHPAPLRTLVDADLLGYDTVYAAAGTPNSIFPVTPSELVRAVSGTVLDLKE